MTAKPYTYTDESGDELRISPADSCAATATVSADNAYIPAHRLAEVVTALYQAAGQPVPDLPVIHDEAEVDRLAKLIYQITYGHSTSSVTETSEWVARGLLACGLILPEATS